MCKGVTCRIRHAYGQRGCAGSKPNPTNVLPGRTLRRDTPGSLHFRSGRPGKARIKKVSLRKESRTISRNLKKMVVDDSRRRKSGERLNNDFNGATVLPPLFGRRPPRIPLLDLILSSCLAVFPRPRNLVGCKLISPISYATVH